MVISISKKDRCMQKKLVQKRAYSGSCTSDYHRSFSSATFETFTAGLLYE